MPRIEQPDPSPIDPEADKLVARGFWRSVAVIAFIAAAIVAFRMLRTKPTQPAGSGAPVAAPAPSAIAPVPGVAFREVAREAGVDFIHESGARGDKLLPECLGGGVAIVDLDGDGWLDLVFSQGQPLEPKPGDSAAGRGGIRIYMNQTGAGGALRFARLAGDEALAAGSYPFGIAAGDVDSDGRDDLYLACLGQDRLLLNRAGAGSAALTFVEAPLPTESKWGTSAGMLDVDRDGDFDIVVANYVLWSPEIDRAVNYSLDGIGRAYGPPIGFEGATLTLLVNDGGAFRDSTEAAGLAIKNPVSGVPFAKALGLVFTDIDRDGRADILVANDKTPKFALRNETPEGGAPRFRDIGVGSGFAYDRDGNSTGAMGIDASWLEGSGAGAKPLAIAVGNFANEPTSLYINVRADGAPLFSDDALGEGIGAPTRRALTFGALFADVDLDGDEDFIQANGHLEPDIARIQPAQSYAQPAQCFMRRAESSSPLFIEATAGSLGDLATPAVGRALASGDLDRDGDEDLVLVELGGAARVLVNAQATGNRWLAVRAPIGTEVELTLETGGTQRVLRREVRPTRSYLAQCEPVARFGLGAAGNASLVRVRFPDGRTREWKNVAANAVLSTIDVP